LLKDFPDAKKVRCVTDNLNTHTYGALYEAFPAHHASALAKRLELHYTPKHGSWLNIAEICDLPSILTLQKLVYQSEAELVGDYSIQPLTQTLESITNDFNNGVILKATDNDEIIGSVRVHFSENTVFIGKLIVTPLRQNQGIGKALLLAAENLYPDKRFELFTSDKSIKI